MLQMEYILNNTDIFDEEIGSKFNKVIRNNADNFIKGKAYRFMVSFHVNLLDDIRFDEFTILVPSKTNKGTRKDKIYDVMHFQLARLEEALNDNEIEVYNTTIQGDNLEEENIIRIEIIEDNSEPNLMGRGKKKTRSKVKSIVPSLPYTRGTVTKLASEGISKRFYDLMNIIRSNKILSEILKIEETEDREILFQAFAKQYGELWLTTDKRERELQDQLKERVLFVLNKHIAEEENA